MKAIIILEIDEEDYKKFRKDCYKEEKIHHLKENELFNEWLEGLIFGSISECVGLKSRTEKIYITDDKNKKVLHKFEYKYTKPL